MSSYYDPYGNDDWCYDCGEHWTKCKCTSTLFQDRKIPKPTNSKIESIKCSNCDKLVIINNIKFCGNIKEAHICVHEYLEKDTHPNWCPKR